MLSEHQRLRKSASVKIQKVVQEQHSKAYKDWLNFINQDEPHVNDIFTDLRSGLALIKLMEKLTGKTLDKKYDKNPKDVIHERDNIELLIGFMKRNKVDVRIVAQDIFDQNKKQILQLFNTLVRKYHYKEHNLHPNDFNKWLSTIFGREVYVEKEYMDEHFWEKLINYFRVDSVLEKEFTNDPKANMNYCFTAARDFLGIPIIMEPSLVASGFLDDEVLTMYLVYYVLNDKNIRDDEEIKFLQNDIISVSSPSQLSRSTRARPKTMNLTMAGSRLSEKLDLEDYEELNLEDMKGDETKTESEGEKGLVEEFSNRRDNFNKMGETELELRRMKEENERIKKALKSKQNECAEMTKKVGELNDSITQKEKSYIQMRDEREKIEEDLNEKLHNMFIELKGVKEEREKLINENTEKGNKINLLNKTMDNLQQEKKQTKKSFDEQINFMEGRINTIQNRCETQVNDERLINETLKKSNNAFILHNAELTSTNELLKKENEELKKENNKITEELSQVKSSTIGEKEEINIIKKEKSELEEIIKQLKKENEELKTENENNKKEIKELTLNIQEIQTLLNKTQTENSTKISELEEKLKDSQKELGEIQINLNQEKEINNKLNEQISKCNKEIQSLNDKNIELEKLISTLQQEIENNKKEVENSKKEVEDMKYELEHYKSDDNDREHQLVDLQTEVTQLKYEIQSFILKQQKADEQIKDLENQISNLQKEKEDILHSLEVEKQNRIKIEEESQKTIAEFKKNVELFGVLDEDDRKSLFISIALAIKLALNTKVSNDLSITELYDEIKEKSILLKNWNNWLFERLSHP
ncbi:kinetochore protein NDC80, putative [Entamoeba histolytica HM-3:IMSS]|uniref:Kinetochore protein NDC80, putative n=5 Tax=Entamoeba histolytica TaxID=5759 RepID=M7W6B0_ENTHI|nr:kinetochore protein NDC80, putative [Entamoeba histolytica HM-3:IMSS]